MLKSIEIPVNGQDLQNVHDLWKTVTRSAKEQKHLAAMAQLAGLAFLRDLSRHPDVNYIGDSRIYHYSARSRIGAKGWTPLNYKEVMIM